MATREWCVAHARSLSARACACTHTVQLCDRPVGAGYRGSEIFMVRKGFGIMGGDWVSNNGRGGHSAFDKRYFIDENFVVRHSTAGVLTMANGGVHGNNSVFMITLAPLPHLGACLRARIGR